MQLPRSFPGPPQATTSRSPHPRLYGSVQAGRAKRARLEGPASQQPVWPPRPASGTPMPANKVGFTPMVQGVHRLPRQTANHLHPGRLACARRLSQQQEHCTMMMCVTCMAYCSAMPLCGLMLHK